MAQWIHLERGDIAAIALFAAVISVLGLAVPVVVQNLVSTVAFGSVLQPLVVLTTILFGALGLSAFLKALQTWVAETMQRRLFIRVVSDLAHRLPRVPLDAWDGSYPPERVNRFFDIFIIQKNFLGLLIGGVEVALTLGVGSLVLALYHPVFLVFDVVLVLAVIGLVVSRIRRGAETAIDESHAKYAMVALLQELAHHPGELKLAGGPDWVLQRADALAASYLEARSRHFRVLFAQTAAALTLYAVASAVALGAGGWLVIGRSLTLGQLVAAELVVTAIVGALVQLGKHLESLYDLLAALDKVGHVVDLPVERAEGDLVIPDEPPQLGVENLSLVAGGQELVTGLSFDVEAGSRILIQGTDARARTAIMEALAAVREAVDGVVRVAGRDVRDLAPQPLRKQLMLIGRPALFSGTVFENVAMGQACMERQCAHEALDAVGMNARDLPQGLESRLLPEGAPLGPEGAVRLALARAFASRPKVLLLDGTLDGLSDAALEDLLPRLVDPSCSWTLVVSSGDDRLRRYLPVGPSLSADKAGGGASA